MKTVCIFGIGGVGGYFGGKIALSGLKNGLKVYFIARGKHLDEIRENGLLLNDYNGETLIIRPTEATGDVTATPVPDLILLCVKGYDLEEAVKQISGNIREDTIVLPLLNGADVYERVRNHLEKGIVLPACLYVSSFVERPGTVTLKSEGGKILLGPDPRMDGINYETLKSFLNDAGIRYQWHEDPRHAIWQKYAFITTFALVTAYLGKGMGDVTENKESLELVGNVLEEVIRVAKKEGVELTREGVLLSAGFGRGGLSKDAKTSFQRDVERKSPKHEGDLLAGTFIRLGKKHNIPTPVAERLYIDILKRLE